MHNSIYQQENACCAEHFHEKKNPVFLKILLEELKNCIEDEVLRKMILNATGRVGYPLLVLAAAKDSIEMINELKESGIDMNTRSQTGDTVLHFLATLSHGDIISREDRSFEFYSIEDGDYQDTINYLISSGTNPNLKNMAGLTFYDIYKSIREVKNENFHFDKIKVD